MEGLTRDVLTQMGRFESSNSLFETFGEDGRLTMEHRQK